MADATKPRGPQNAGTFASWLSLIGRLGAGQVFIFAGLIKVADPAEVARSIQAFGVVENDSLISLAAYVIPWTEIIAGVLLVAGLFTRAAATVILLMLAGFVALILNAMNKGQELTCGCFGKIELFCSGPLGRCNLIQDGVFAALALMPLILGGGRASADALGKAPTDPYASYGEDEDEAFD